jgi:hypothetical protein
LASRRKGKRRIDGGRIDFALLSRLRQQGRRNVVLGKIPLP